VILVNSFCRFLTQTRLQYCRKISAKCVVCAKKKIGNDCGMEKVRESDIMFSFIKSHKVRSVDNV
jgi:hypothetical protein